MRIGFCDGARINDLVAQRADVLTEVKDELRLRFCLARFRRNPIDRVEPARCGFDSFRITDDVLRLFGNGRGAGRCLYFRFNLRRAFIHVLRILLDRGGFEINANRRGQKREADAYSACNLFIFGVHILIEEDERQQGQEGDNCNNRAELVLDEKFKRL